MHRKKRYLIRINSLGVFIRAGLVQLKRLHSERRGIPWETGNDIPIYDLYGAQACSKQAWKENHSLRQCDGEKINLR